MAVSEESLLLDEVAQRRTRILGRAATLTPQMGQLAASYADAYPSMDPTLIQSFVQAGLPADLPQVQSIADQAARQAAEDGDFTNPAEEVPDAWYETLWNTATSWAKPVVRTGFTILSLPFEEIQALLSSAGQALFDESEPSKAELPFAGAGNILQLANPGTYAAYAGDIAEELADPVKLISDFWTNFTEKAARSGGSIAISNLLEGKPAGLGEGFLPGGEVYAEREAAKYRLQLDGQFVTPGRIMARMVTEPGSFAYQTVSGLADFEQNIVLDPAAAALMGVGKSNKAAQSFQAIGAIPGVRKTVSVEQGVNHFLTSPAGQRTVRALTENRDVYRAWKAIGQPGQGGLNLARRLAATTDDTETFDILADTLGLVVRERPSARFVTKTIAGPKNHFGTLMGSDAKTQLADNTRLDFLGRIGRLGEDMPANKISIHDPDGAARELDLWMVNAQIPEATRASYIEQLSRVEAGDQVGMYNAVLGPHGVLSGAEGALVKEWGVSPARARKLTASHQRLSDDLTAYDFDDMGRNVDTLAPLRIDVEGTMIDVRPTPGLISELIDDVIHLPDARDIRRVTPIVKQLQGVYDSGLWKGSVDFADAVMTQIWKPLQLLRGAYTVRVVGEEQVRVAASGYDSLFNHPASAIAWQLSVDPQSRLGKRVAEGAKKLIDPKGTQTMLGEAWDDVVEHQSALSRGSAGHRGLPGEILTGRYVKARHGDEGFYPGWVAELSHEANDPVMRRVAGGLSEGDLRSIGRSGGKSAAGTRTVTINGKATSVEWTTPGGRQFNAADVDQVGLDAAGNRKVLLADGTVLGPDEIDSPMFKEIMRAQDEYLRRAQAAGKSPNPKFYTLDDAFDELADVADEAPLSTFDDVSEWFWSGTGQKWRKQLGKMEGREALLTDRRAADGYLKQNMFDRLERMTGGDPDLVELVAKGRLGEVNLRGDRGGSKLAGILESEYDHAAPNFVKAPESVRRLGATKRTGDRLDAFVEHLFGALMSRPTNYLSRSPTFRQKYWQRGSELISSADRATQEAIIRAAREANVGDKILTDMASQMLKGEGTRLHSLDDVDALAKSFALSETKTLLYDLQKRSQFFDMMRLVFPFGEAWKEIVTAWTRILRQNPSTIRRFQQALEGARGPSVLGKPETSQGTGEGFFHVDPQTGQEVFTYPGGSLASKMLGLGEGGAGVNFVGNVSGLNIVAATAIPGFGPAVQIPASHLIPNTPKWDDLRNVILPFGDSESPIAAVLPSWAEKLREVFSQPDKNHRQFANTVTDVMRALAATGKYSLTTAEGQQKLLDAATSKAKILYFIRGIAQSTVPTGPSLQWNTKDVQGNIIPVKVLSDDLRRLTEEYGGDRTAAFNEWVTRYGVDNVLAVIGKSESVLERPVTEQGDSWLRAHAEAERDFPLSIGYFAPEPAAGAFDYTAYLRAFETGAREATTPAEQLALANDFLGRVQWEQAKKIAAGRPGPVTGIWLAQVRTQIAAEYPGFDGWVSQRIAEQHPTAEQTITELRDAVNNPELAQTDAGRGIIKYLSAITVAEQLVTQLPGNVRRYQQAKSAAPIRALLRSAAREIIAQHPDFARVWTGVFERELAEDEGV
jgi:hypothetical protein